MKKMYCLLLAVLSVFVLCACNNGTESKELEVDFSEYFGMTMDEYLEATNTSKEAVKEYSDGIGLWNFTEKTMYKETEFIKFLEVDRTENIIIGGRYIAVIENPNESTFELVNSMKQDIEKKFGKPTTYAEPDDMLSNMESFADIIANKGAEETWTVVREKPITIPEYEGTKLMERVELVIDCLDGKARIEMKHRLMVDLKELEVDFSEYFGMTMDEYLEATNTSKEAVKEYSDGIGLWNFTEKTMYKETEFTKFLEVDRTENIIIGGRYIAVIENPDESTFELVNSMKQDIEKKFGKPTTYAEPDDMLSNMESFADIVANKGAEETWTVVREKPITIPEYEGTKLMEQVELVINCLDGKARIEMKHRLRVDLNAK